MSIMIVFFLQSISFGQFNIKVGYALAFASPDVNNKIIRDFNSANSDILEFPLGELNSLHGIMVGARYKIEGGAFEVSWEHLSRKRQGIGETPAMTLFQQELFYSFNQLMLNYESSFGMIGLGTGIVYNNVKIKDRISSSEVKKTIVSDDQLAARFNLAINFSSDSYVSFSIKPFIQIPLNAIDISSLPTELEIGDTSTYDNEKFPLFGISFIFYNGR